MGRLGLETPRRFPYTALTAIPFLPFVGLCFFRLCPGLGPSARLSRLSTICHPDNGHCSQPNCRDSVRRFHAEGSNADGRVLPSSTSSLKQVVLAMSNRLLAKDRCKSCNPNNRCKSKALNVSLGRTITSVRTSGYGLL